MAVNKDLSETVYSVSSVKDFRNCGLKFYLRKVLKQKGIQKGHSSWLGKLVHECVYQSIAEKEQGKDWNLRSEFKPDAARHYFEKIWNQEIFDPEIGEFPTTFYPKSKLESLNTVNQEELRKQWKIQSAMMLENGLQIIEALKIEQIETEIRVELLNRDFIGFIDLISRDEEGRICFFDLKTSWDRPSENALKKDLQFVVYSLALRRILGLDYYPKGKLIHLKSGKMVQFEMDIDMLRAEIIPGIRASILDIEDHIFIANKKSPLCPYCDYYEHCFGKSVDLNTIARIPIN